MSGDGQVLDFLMDPNGEHVSSISAAVEHEGCLFMGNLAGDFVSYVDLGAVVSPNTRGGEVNGASRGGGGVSTSCRAHGVGGRGEVHAWLCKWVIGLHKRHGV